MIVREKLADVNVPEDLQEKELLCLVQFCPSDVWKSDWSFEAISVVCN
jgi:hypothetical protein